MHLYTYEPAPNPQRVAYLLKHKGITLETTSFDLAKGEHFNDSYKSINADCTVPTLVTDDGTVLTDVIAICVYLDKLYPQKSLFGANELEYAQVIGWCHRLFLEGFISVADILRNKSEAFKGRALPGRINVPQIPEMIERGSARLTAFWPYMNEHLSSRQYIVGEQLTQADIDLFVICGFAGWVKASIPTECAELQAWYSRIEQELG